MLKVMGKQHNTLITKAKAGELVFSEGMEIEKTD